MEKENQTNEVEQTTNQESQQASQPVGEQKIDFDSKKEFNLLTEQITNLQTQFLEFKTSMEKAHSDKTKDEDEDIII